MLTIWHRFTRLFRPNTEESSTPVPEVHSAPVVSISLPTPAFLGREGTWWSLRSRTYELHVPHQQSCSTMELDRLMELIRLRLGILPTQVEVNANEYVFTFAPRPEMLPFAGPPLQVLRQSQ